MLNEIGAGSPMESTQRMPQRRKAAGPMVADMLLPSVAINSDGHANGENQRGLAIRERGAGRSVNTDIGMPLAQTIAALVALQKQRRFCIKSQSRINRACEAFIATQLGYSTELQTAERKALFERAATIRTAVERGDIEAASSVCVPIILHSKASRVSWDRHRANVEREMRKLARTLPLYSWTERVAGFGDLGLAIVIGETGDLTGYATKERVWKRLGLAVVGGVRQQKRTNVEEALAHGYNPKRRAEIWALADAMFRHQWRKEKDGVQAHAVGPYGEVYARRKAHTATRDWTLKHRDEDARRVMSKALIEDLWRVWRGLPSLHGTDPERHCPAAENLPQ